jgi:hypothetical protein
MSDPRVDEAVEVLADTVALTTARDPGSGARRAVIRCRSDLSSPNVSNTARDHERAIAAAFGARIEVSERRRPLRIHRVAAFAQQTACYGGAYVLRSCI